MVHKPGLAEHDFDHVDGRATSRSSRCPEFIRLHEAVAGARRAVEGRRRSPSTRRSTPDEADARRIVAETAAQTGLPTDDPVRFGPDRLWAAIRPAVEALVP